MEEEEEKEGVQAERRGKEVSVKDLKTRSTAVAVCLS